MIVAGISIEVVRKNIRNVHLSVYPPDGRVRLASPKHLKEESLRLFVIDKLGWIRRQQEALASQARESQRQYIPAESIYVWGQRYLLRLTHERRAADVTLEVNKLILNVPEEANREAREKVMLRFYRREIRERLGELLAKWLPKLNVPEPRVYVQRMKTRWGSCSPNKLLIRLNTDLARKPVHCLEYILVHELVHLIEHTHNARFQFLMDRHMPNWRHYRDDLNRAPLAHVDWDY